MKVAQLADDMTIIVKNILSLQLSLNIINVFYQASGLKLNYTKTEILATGRRAPFYTNQNPYRLKWVKDRVYGLGTWFYKDHRKTVRENNSTKIAKVKESVKLWKSRKLTWFGKITVIKSILLSQINYTISSIEANKNFADVLQKCLVLFLWDEKPAKIKFTTATGAKYNGGLGLTRVESFVKSQKISWIKRILGNEKHITVQHLKRFLPEMDLNDFLNCDCDPLMLPYNIPNFYGQVHFAWFEYKSISDVKKDIPEMSIWYNRNIMIANKVVWKPIWYYYCYQLQ